MYPILCRERSCNPLENYIADVEGWKTLLFVPRLCFDDNFLLVFISLFFLCVRISSLSLFLSLRRLIKEWKINGQRERGRERGRERIALMSFSPLYLRFHAPVIFCTIMAMEREYKRPKLWSFCEYRYKTFSLIHNENCAISCLRFQY